MAAVSVIEKYPVVTLIGERSSGKTTFALGDDGLGVPSVVFEHCRKYGIPKVLVVDTVQDRDSYAHVRVIRHPSEHKSGCVRIVITPENKERLIKAIYDTVRDTFILWEDAKNILPTKLDGTIYESMLVDGKNKRCTMWFMYHGYTVVPARMYIYLDELIVFKTKNHPKGRKSDIVNYEAVLEAYEKVMKHKSPYYNLKVKNG